MPFRRVTVGFTTAKIISFNPKRTGFIVMNNGENLAYVHDHNVNIWLDGLPLPPSATLTFSKVEQDRPELDYWAAALGDTALSIVEVFEA